MLGRMLVDEADRMNLRYQSLNVIAIGKMEVKANNPFGFKTIPDESIVINAAGIVKGRDDVQPHEMVRTNSLLPHEIATHTNVKRIIQVSTDCVFDGRKHEPYSEADQPSPVDLYGRSKLAGELLHESNALTVRTSFVGFGKRGLISWLLAHPENGSIEGYQNWPWNGLYARTVARQLLTLALDSDMTGLLHLEGEVLIKGTLLEQLAQLLRPDLTVRQTTTQVSRRMVLGSYRISGLDIPHWSEQLKELKTDAEELGLIASDSL